MAVWTALMMVLVCAAGASAQVDNPPEARSLWDVDQPLCTELLTDTPPPLASEGSMMWAQIANAVAMRPLAARQGWDYRLDQWLEEHHRRQFHLLRSPPVILEPSAEAVQWHEQHGLTYVYYCFYYDRSAQGKYPFILDPEFTELCLRDLEQALRTHPELIWGVFAGDEQIPKLREQVPELMQAGPEKYPYIAQVAEEVQRDYGFGKWGPPESPEDRNPLRWSALYRWGLAKFRERQARVAEIARRLKPEARLISTDPTSAVHPYEFSLMGRDLDIITNQMQPWDNNSRLMQWAFVTKMIADLSGRDVWPCPHLNRITTGISPTPDGAREVYSVLALNGATGFHLYLRDCYAGPGKGVDTYVVPYGDPERWRQMMAVYDRVQSGELPRRPEPDCALYFSNDAHQALRVSAAYPCQHAYAGLGPILGAWFQVLDEHTMPETAKAVQRYRAVFLPTAEYIRQEAVEALEQYVRAGGTLVLADPRAFSFHLDGTDTSARREALSGARLGEPVEATQCQIVGNSLLPDAASTVMQLRGEARALEVDDAEVLARYLSGEAAITCATRGQGRCIYFGFNIFPDKGYGTAWRWLADDVLLDEGWRDFLQELCGALGIRTGREIWRFRYPAAEPLPEPTGVCLTGNAVQWYMEQPQFEHNRAAAGSYSYSVAPDLIPDLAEGDIAFTAGNLTDRRDATTPDADPQVAPYVVAWQTTMPVEISFDLAGAEPVSRVRVFLSGNAPRVVLASSADGQTWAEASSAEPGDLGEDVAMVELAGPEHACRYLKLTMAERPPDATVTACEVEVWGAQ